MSILTIFNRILPKAMLSIAVSFAIALPLRIEAAPVQPDADSASVIDMYKNLAGAESAEKFDKMHQQMDDIINNEATPFNWLRALYIGIIIAFIPLVLLLIYYFRGGNENATLRNTISAGLILAAGLFAIYASGVGWYYFTFHLGYHAQHAIFSLVVILIVIALVIYYRHYTRRSKSSDSSDNSKHHDNG